MYRKLANQLLKYAEYLENNPDFYNAMVVKIIDFEGETPEKMYYLTNNFSLIDIVKMLTKSELPYKVKIVQHLKDVLQTDSIKEFISAIADLYDEDMDSPTIQELENVFEEKDVK